MFSRRFLKSAKRFHLHQLRIDRTDLDVNKVYLLPDQSCRRQAGVNESVKTLRPHQRASKLPDANVNVHFVEWTFVVFEFKLLLFGRV